MEGIHEDTLTRVVNAQEDWTIVFQLTKTLGYAIWVLVHLGRQPQDVVPTAEIAQECRLSPTYLAKVVSLLQRQGLLTSSRGAGGGIRLRKEPEDISLADIVHAIHGWPEATDCQVAHIECALICSCPVKTLSSLISVQLEKILQGATLLDLIESNDRSLPPLEGALMLYERGLERGLDGAKELVED